MNEVKLNTIRALIGEATPKIGRFEAMILLAHILGKPKSHRIFGTARVGERGQIVIPKEARQFYGIRPGDTVLVLGSGESGLVLSKPEVLDRVAQQILEDMGRNEEK